MPLFFAPVVYLVPFANKAVPARTLAQIMAERETHRRAKSTSPASLVPAARPMQSVGSQPNEQLNHFVSIIIKNDESSPRPNNREKAAASTTRDPTTPMATLMGRLGVPVNIPQADIDRVLQAREPAALPAGYDPGDRAESSVSVDQVLKLQAAARKLRAQYAATGIPSTIQRRPPGPAETPTDAWQRRQGNYLFLLSVSVADTSATTYTTGWKHWCNMCREYAMDPFLQIPPPMAARGTTVVPIPFKIAAVLHYIAYLAERGGIESHQLKATTIADYCSAVRHFLQINLVDVTFMAHPVITKTKSALANKDRFNDLRGDTKTLAFSADMIVYYKTQIARDFDPHDRAIVMALELQFTALNRVSELLPTAADYYARAVDIKFGFDLTGDGTITNLFSEHSWSKDISTLRSMTFRIRGSKTDQQRLGVTLYFEVMDEASPDVAFCVVSDAFRWAQQARPRGRDAFLSFRNKWVLTYEEYNAAIKTTASRMDFQPERFSTHALRIGGASALAAAGLPDWQIKKLGRWKSLAFLEYIQTALTSMRAAQLAMVNPSLFSVKDTRLIHQI